MAVTGKASPADEIAGALEARRAELVDAAWEAIGSRLPAYRAADAATAADVLEHIRAHHDLLCAVLRRGRPAEARELAFAGRHAAMRARRGIALEDFLAAFRCYHAI